MVLEVLVPRDESRGLQEVGAPGPALRLRDLDTDRYHEGSPRLFRDQEPAEDLRVPLV